MPALQKTEALLLQEQASRGNPVVVRALLAAGADEVLVNNAGETARKIASRLRWLQMRTQEAEVWRLLGIIVRKGVPARDPRNDSVSVISHCESD